TPRDDDIRISKEDFSKLSFRQKFAVTEYGYLLSLEDAEVVGKMLGSIGKEKDVLPFCQAKGKKVFSFEKSSNSTNPVKYWGLIGLLAGLIPGLIIFFLTRGTQIDAYNMLIGSVGIFGGFFGASLGRTKTTVWVAAISTSILGVFLLLIILGSICAFCMKSE